MPDVFLPCLNKGDDDDDDLTSLPPPPPPAPTGFLLESPYSLSLVFKDAQTDTQALGLLCQDAWEGASGDNFLQGQPNFFKGKITDP